MKNKNPPDDVEVLKSHVSNTINLAFQGWKLLFFTF